MTDLGAYIAPAVLTAWALGCLLIGIRTQRRDTRMAKIRAAALLILSQAIAEFTAETVKRMRRLGIACDDTGRQIHGFGDALVEAEVRLAARR